MFTVYIAQLILLKMHWQSFLTMLAFALMAFVIQSDKISLIYIEMQYSHVA